MLCPVCQKNPASVEFTLIINGTKESVRLCPACHAARGLAIDPSLIEVGTPKVEVEKTASPTPAPTDTETCPHCGLSWREFRRTKRFGCAHDYSLFTAGIERLLETVHGASIHLGRGSERAAARLVRRRRVEGLRAELEQAVAVEDYAKAAELRDRIRCLEREGDDERAAV